MDNIAVLDLNDPDLPCKIHGACVDCGFFYIANHGVEKALQTRLIELSRAFFQNSLADKMQIHMKKGGRAWRGYFPVGEELTSGKADQKEGLYFGSELSPQHPLVKAQTPLHGPNLFPASPRELKPTVLSYMDALTKVGHRLMEALSSGLGLRKDYFHRHYTKDPLVLFRIFHYPPTPAEGWGVGEHTDYGVLTILLQDDHSGLEVKTPGGWVAAPPLQDTFVCNIGDMLERMTGGLYRSTAHRVRNQTQHGRLSFPFFFDPGFFTKVKRLPTATQVVETRDERWDKSSVHEFSGTYGDYLLGKVSRVFPQLSQGYLQR